MKGFILIFFALILSSNLYSTTIRVPQDIPTIQAALDSAQVGDSVVVSPGSYFEQIYWPPNDSITLTSLKGPDSTLVDGGDLGYIEVRYGNNHVLNGFKLAHFKQILIESDNFNFVNCMVEDFVTDKYQSVMRIQNASNVKIINNSFTYCISDEGIISLVHDANALITQNIFSNNQNPDRPYDIGVIDLGFGNNHGRIHADIINNVIYSNDYCGIYIYRSGIKRNKIINNIISNNNYVGFYSVNYKDYYDYNNLYDNNPNYRNIPYIGYPINVPGISSISMEPQFIDPSNSDFRLSENSPCINAGKDSIDMGVYPQFNYYSHYEAPILYGPFSGTANSLTIKWTSSKDPNFISYKIHLDSLPTVNINSYLLQEISNRLDTTLIIGNLEPNSKYFVKCFTYSSEHYVSSVELPLFTCSSHYPFLNGWPKMFGDTFFDNSVIIYDVTENNGRELGFISSDGDLYLLDKFGEICSGWPQHINFEYSCGGPTIADLDQDGKPEVIGIGDSLYVWDPEGSIKSGWPVSIGAGDNDEIVKPPITCDLDGDGYMEIVYNLVYTLNAFHFDGSHVLGWGDAIPGFEGSNYRPAPSFADLDNDGEHEVIQNALFKTFVFDGDGSNYPGWPQEIEGSSINPAVTGDINNDGVMDIVGGVHWNYNQLHVWDRDGAELPGWPVRTINSYYDKSAPALVDLDNDDSLEIIICADDAYSSDKGIINILKYDGSYLDGWPITVPFKIPSATTIADIDGDGQNDIIFTTGLKKRYESGYIYAYSLEGEILDNFPISVPDPIDNSSIALGDINMDGYVDLAVTTLGGGVYVFSSKGDTSSIEWASYQNDNFNSGSYQKINFNYTSINNFDYKSIKEIKLFNNYPNPFNPQTTIKYQLPKTTQVKLEIFNILGQSVKTIINGQQSAGFKTAIWDGKNNSGQQVSSGIFLYRIQTPEYSKIMKMLMLK